jgi:hypothetical protein
LNSARAAKAVLGARKRSKVRFIGYEGRRFSLMQRHRVRKKLEAEVNVHIPWAS